MLTHASLFSGIGGFDLAAQWAGWENLFHCEWNPFGQKVLKHHFPNSISYNDITKTDFTIHRGQVDILSGGFPCQPYSSAGKRLGKEDERHLWPEMLRTIREIKPRWVVGENVRGLVSWNDGLVFHEVQSDLEAEGYEVQPFLIPAAGVNAPHQRYRIWFVAFKNSNSNGWNGNKREKESNIWEQRNTCSGNNDQLFANNNEIENAANSDNARQQTFNIQITKLGKSSKKETLSGNGIESIYSRLQWESFPIESPICGGNDGLPKELDGITFPKWRKESIKAYGNAIVPQVAFNIFKSINEYEKLIK